MIPDLDAIRARLAARYREPDIAGIPVVLARAAVEDVAALLGALDEARAETEREIVAWQRAEAAQLEDRLREHRATHGREEGHRTQDRLRWKADALRTAATAIERGYYREGREP